MRGRLVPRVFRRGEEGKHVVRVQNGRAAARKKRRVCSEESIGVRVHIHITRAFGRGAAGAGNEDAASLQAGYDMGREAAPAAPVMPAVQQLEALHASAERERGGDREEKGGGGGGG